VAERPRLEAVLLDAGGTLVRLDFEWMAEVVRSLGVETDAARVRRAEIAGRRAYDASRGHPPGPGEPPPPLGATGDTRAYFGGTLLAAGVPAPLVDRALDRFLARQAAEGLWTRPMEGARRALDGLVALRLKLAVVSNSDGRAEFHLRECGVFEGVGFVVDSHRVAIEKPDPRIFAIALERLAVPAARALFVGDIRSVDVAGARAAGLQFVLIDPYGDYAAPGEPSIRGMDELPEWVARHFEVPAARAGEQLADPRVARRREP